MLVEQETFDKKKYLQLFNKRFWNFIEKTPLFLKYSIVENDVLLYDYSQSPETKPIKFPLDFTIDTKLNIKNIKDYLLENNYPRFKVKHMVTRPLDTFEIRDTMEKEHVTFKEASLRTQTKTTEKEYRLEKVFNQDNRIAVRDLTSGEMALYQLKIPVTYFMKEVFNGLEENVANIFVTKTELVKYMLDKKQA